MQILHAQAPDALLSRAQIAEKIGQTVLIHGSIHKIRRMSGFAFLLLRTHRDVLQCVYDPDICPTPLETLEEEDCCEIEARVCAQPRARDGWELSLTRIRVLSRPAAAPGVVIHRKKLDASLETLLDCRPATLRHPLERAIFRIQDALVRGMCEFLTRESFTQVHTPKLVAESAEGGANVFRLPYFGKTATLAQSPQFYKQTLTGVFQRVFEIGPVFRAEKHDTARHLNEYTSVDAEMGYIESFETIMRLESAMLCHALSVVANQCAPEIESLGVRLPDAHAIPCIRFADAKQWIARETGARVTDPFDFAPEEEQTLCRLVQAQTGCEFVFVTHYPGSKRPFYAMDDPLAPDVTLSFDLLFRGMEITTGGQRIHDYTAQVQKMRARGMRIEPFESYLAAHQAGLPPHGGFGLGLERLTARLCGFDNVRRGCLFPRDTARLLP
jgi:nondiscriminating aspartyl-tRNA synthetase